jgi:hypothetical protein
MNGEPWVWLKRGDHREEGHMLWQRCAADLGSDGTADVEVRFVQTPTGNGYTLLLCVTFVVARTDEGSSQRMEGRAVGGSGAPLRGVDAGRRFSLHGQHSCRSY